MPAQPGFLGFAERVLADLQQSPARHHKALIARLEDVAEGRCDRLMVQMPPGSAKSTYGSVLFPAYFMQRQLRGQVIAVAHTASLAHHFGRQVRQVIAENEDWLGVGLTKDSRAAGEFRLLNGGAYFASGVRGPITGRRADLIIIDDPIKSWAEAESLTFRDALHDWYRAELTARLRPHGKIVFIMTRWHEDDLAGRLVLGGGEWETLRLPALALAGDPLGRAVGEALWPEWQSAETIMRLRNEIGERSFSAMYQQEPKPSDSATFDVSKIAILPASPEIVRVVRAWDLAATAAASGRNPDYTVGLKLGAAVSGLLVVLDILRMRGGAGEVEAAIVATAARDGRQTLIGLRKDPGQAGIAQVEYLKRALDGYQVDATPETGAKATRAMPAAAEIDKGNFAVLAAPWNENFFRELEAFPDSAKDDQVDALARAVGLIWQPAAQAARRRHVPILGR